MALNEEDGEQGPDWFLLPPSLDHTALLPVGGGGEARQGLGEQVPVPLWTSAVSRWAF